MKKATIKLLDYILIVVILVLFFYFEKNNYIEENNTNEIYVPSSIPDYSGKDYIYINNNIPEFDDLAHSTETFEVYSELDSLGRCGAAYANLGKNLMPTGPRENISSIKPTGWQISKYDFIDQEYLYNRCHLIAYSLAGETLNEKNLITCTRHMNSTTMLQFENKILEYIRKTNHHVLYRVTPFFDGNNLIAKGVQMEALSIEDEEIKFNVFVYNVEPGIEIDYFTGNNKLIEK